jgi:regulator of sigma E protease
VLILVHEVGHFVAAKAVGIGVPRFSIGLGPKVWGFRRGETEYVISALPLGGYVRMAGTMEEEQAALEGGETEEEFPPERRFESKPLWARVIVISAGVLMNTIFAWLAFSFLVFQEGRLPAVIGDVEPGTPAEAAGLLPGDRILAVDGKRVEYWREFATSVWERPGQELVLEIERGGETLRVSTVAEPTPSVELSGDSILVGRIGVAPDTLQAREPVSVGYALAGGARQTVAIAGAVFDFLGGLITRRASPRDVAGVLTIGELSGRFARAGLRPLIWLMAFLSVNLAIVNLLPIPILDGGHLVFLAIEAVRGRSVSLETRERAARVGLVVLFIIMVWALTADVLRLVER